MHRCWSILEVQRAIFHEVYFLPFGKVTLAHVAQTCHTLNSVALDVLWANLDSFVHLIKCLPRDLWEIFHTRLIFLRPMSLKDWAVFFSYSNRVRILSQNFDSMYRTKCSSVDINVIHTLSNPPTSGPLIPNLRELRWDAPDKAHVPLLRVLLTPTLVTLSLKSCAPRFPESLPLTSIGIICLSLKSLHITWSTYIASALRLYARDQKVLSEMIPQLHSLEVLSCTMPDEGAVVHLSHLPSLVDLTLELPSDFQPDRIRHYVAPPAFASLRSLKLHADSLSTLTSLIESMRFKPREVELELENAPTPEALRLFFLTLVRACDPKELLHISFTARIESPPAIPQDVAFTLSTLQPFLALPNINKFKFDMPCDIALDDAAIVSLTTYWPNITTLSINADSGWCIPSRVTHHGLIMLLRRCTALREFALAIDFSQVDRRSFDMTRLGGGVSNVRCRVANFVTSTIESSPAIALFLSDVCPNLMEVRSSWFAESDSLRTDVFSEEVEEYDRRWKEVNNFLPAFLAARKQSVYWA